MLVVGLAAAVAPQHVVANVVGFHDMPWNAVPRMPRHCPRHPAASDVITHGIPLRDTAVLTACHEKSLKIMQNHVKSAGCNGGTR